MHTEGSSEPTIQLKWSLAPRPEPADSYQVRILKTPDYAQFETQNNWPDNRLFAQAKTQGWFYSLKLWIIFKILLKFKYLPWNKLHYWVLEQSGFCNWDFCHLHAKCVRAAVSCVCVCVQPRRQKETNEMLAFLQVMGTLNLYDSYIFLHTFLHWLHAYGVYGGNGGGVMSRQDGCQARCSRRRFNFVSARPLVRAFCSCLSVKKPQDVGTFKHDLFLTL